MKKILVIDDSKTIRKLCEWMYQGLEDKLLTADSGTSARNIINQESPDVIIVDYTLPDMDSYIFISTIKDRAKVIMLGGTYAPFDENKALSHGAVLTLMKPFKSTDFFKAVEDAMNAVSAKPEEPVISSISPAPTYSSTPISVPASSISARGQNTAEQISQPKSTLQSLTPITTSFNQPFSYSSSKDFAQEEQHTGPAPIKRFTFPGTDSAPKSEAPQNPFAPPASRTEAAETRHHEPVNVSHAQENIDATAMTPRVDREIKGDVKSESFSTQERAVQPPTPQVDPELLRAEVISAVKTLLPAIVNSYLKKLIQIEVKPQLQKWVDTRVASLIRKMNDNDQQ